MVLVAPSETRTSRPELPGEIKLRPVSGPDAEFLFAVYASTRTEELARVGWTDAPAGRVFSGCNLTPSAVAMKAITRARSFRSFS